MTFPSVPNERWNAQEAELDNESGLTTSARVYLTTMSQELQRKFSNEGHLLPNQTSDNIEKLNTQESKGKFLFDQDTEESKMNNKGTYEAVGFATKFLTTAQISALTTPQLTELNGKMIENTDTSKLFYVLNAVLKEVSLV